MQAINFLVDFIFEAFITVFILRLWLQAVRADFYNPISQFVVKISNPLVLPCRRFIPSIGRLDTTTLLLALILSIVKLVIFTLMNNGEMNISLLVYIGVLSLIKQMGVLLYMIMLIMAIMSFVVQTYNPTLALFQQLASPVINPLRRLIPPVGGLDLSVLAAFILLNVINLLLADILPYWAFV